MCCRICAENEGKPSAFGISPGQVQPIHREISHKWVHFWLQNWLCVPPRLQGATQESAPGDATHSRCQGVSSERSPTGQGFRTF